MRRREESNALRLQSALAEYEGHVGPLAGIALPGRRWAFVEQLVESDRRNRYVKYLVTAELSAKRLEPASGIFDPLKGAILDLRADRIDEAFWKLFLFIHFGRHRTAGYATASDVYGRLGSGGCWDWASVRQDVAALRTWLNESIETLASRPHGFGNHRKYESLSESSPNGTGAVVESYIEWVGKSGNHRERFDELIKESTSAESAFDSIYRSMNSIRRFGRTARFDYLSMASKVGLLTIRAGRTYLEGSTGPLAGARLLFDSPPGNDAAIVVALDDRLIELEQYLRVGFDELEDALCNWQKSPDVFKPFRG